jgi:hypothetical protein
MSKDSKAEADKRTATAVRKLKKSIDDNRRLDARCNVYYETIEQQALQLKALQDAVMALGPHHRRFGTDHQFNFHSKGLQCVECDAMDGHAEDCPVVKLREVLIGQGVSDE